MKNKITGTYPIATATVELFDQNVKSGKLESFTFDKQKKFGYIEIIGKHVEENIPQFVEIWPFLGAYTFNGAWDPDIDEDLEFIGNCTLHGFEKFKLCVSKHGFGFNE